MSRKQRARIHVVRSCVEGLAATMRAAAMLGLTTRRVRQLKAAFRLQGEVAAIHRNSRRPSPKRLAGETRRRIVEIRGLEEHVGCNTTQFAEILRTRYGIAVSRSTVARALAEAGVGRRSMASSTMPRGPSQDSTYAKTSTLCGYLEAARQTLVDHGIPMALHPDRHGVFFVNPKRRDDLTIEERLAGDNERPTQFGQIMKTLGVDIFPAHSPQAKGRIERLWQTLRSRLPVESRRCGMKTIEAANSFLPSYIKEFNKRFAVPTRAPRSAGG